MTDTLPRLSSLDDVVTSGMCIGCGLCVSLGGQGAVQMTMTDEGRLRPRSIGSIEPDTLSTIAAVCPGTAITGLADNLRTPDTVDDVVWGPHLSVDRAHAAEPDVRFMAATGGVLTALALHLLETGTVQLIAHVAPDPNAPMRSVAHISRNRADVLAASGSRYGPTAPLTHIVDLLDAGERFAFVGKPCDVTALRNLARIDARVDDLCHVMLTLVCGGASELGKSTDVLADLGIDEDELSLFRYRGFGNPGRTRIETKDGRAEELTYNDMWEEESTWRLQYRCKVCPDAIGETADVVASDLWPGGGPTGEDAGFNGMITRTAAGAALVAAAIESGHLTVDQGLTARDLDVAQPHQVRKKRAVADRFDALAAAGRLVPQVTGLRIRTLAEQRSEAERAEERQATTQRIAAGQFTEPVA
jgi:coenzyme F420 hydrogenase subunit beta